ncbi:MAG: hypothetical protein CSA11_06825 [Chloroflexi bacterium]|nr:MAG: hypothetical protein CSA11_06825 [Chloroflexota bacterium]
MDYSLHFDMSIGSILLGLSLLILAGLVLGQPFLAQKKRQPRPRSRKQQLLTQKEAVLEEIRALDFDYDTGEIPQEVYEPKRDQLMAVATETLKALDALGTEAPVDDVAAQIEAAINQIRAQRRSGEEPAVAVTAVSPQGQASFCTQCGAKVDAGDKFCAACGHQLAVPV